MEKTFLRTSRHLSPETREKISRSLTGRPKTHAHKEAIRQGELRYWRDDSNFPADTPVNRDQGGTTIYDIM